MEQQIRMLCDLYNLGISETKFIDMLSHCTNGASEPSQYKNILSVDEWIELYAKPHCEIETNAEEINLFFDYLRQFHFNHFGKYRDKYFVNRSFTNRQKQDETFDFEKIVLKSFEIFNS